MTARERIGRGEMTPQFAHGCYEWDGMEIDERDPEFAFCNCDFGEREPTANVARAEASKLLSEAIERERGR